MSWRRSAGCSSVAGRLKGRATGRFVMNAIEDLLQQPAAQAIGWALLQFVWQGALVGLLTAAALVALRRSAADVRYVVATIGLSLMLTMPAVTALQAWRSMTETID